MDAGWSVGSLGPDGPWVGLRPAAAGWQLVAGAPDGTIRTGAATAETVILVAYAFVAEALDAPPPDLEATPSDVRQALRAVGDEVGEGRMALEEAIDGLDDGLATDVVLARLETLLPAALREDPVGELRRLAARLG